MADISYKKLCCQNKARVTLRRGTERDGSAARFDNVGLYVFEKKAEADNFVVNFCGRNN